MPVADDPDLLRAAQAFERAERILLITGAGLSADSGLPTYRGLGGLYNGHTSEGLPIEEALSGPMLRADPALCWKYLAQLGRACLAAEPNAAHLAIADLQRRKPNCWVLTQNIDGLHRRAGSPPTRLIEIHGEMAPLFCQACDKEDVQLAARLDQPLPPLCRDCGGVMRPPVVLFGEMLPESAVEQLSGAARDGFDLVAVIGTTAGFPYICEPLLQARRDGAFTLEINPARTGLSDLVTVRLAARALDVLPAVVGHIRGR